MTENTEKQQYKIVTTRLNGGSMSCWIQAEGLSDALNRELKWLRTPFAKIVITKTED